MRFCNSKHNPMDQIGGRLTDIPEETPATSPQRHTHRKALASAGPLPQKRAWESGGRRSSPHPAPWKFLMLS